MKRIMIAILATLFATTGISAFAAEGQGPIHHSHHHHRHHHHHHHPK